MKPLNWPIACSLVSFLILNHPPILEARADPINDLRLYTENYAPLNFREEGKIQGITVDTLDEMLRRAGSSLTRDDIKLVPWARGYIYVQNQPNTLLFAMTRTEQREPLFHWIGPLTNADIVILGRDDRGLEIESLKDLQNRRIVAVNNDVGHQLLLENGLSPDAIHVVSQPHNAVGMLHLNRVQYWAYERMVALWYLSHEVESKDSYKTHYVLKQSHYYFAASRNTDPTVISRLQQALDAMRADGSLQEILDRYLGS